MFVDQQVAERIRKLAAQAAQQPDLSPGGVPASLSATAGGQTPPIVVDPTGLADPASVPGGAFTDYADTKPPYANTRPRSLPPETGFADPDYLPQSTRPAETSGSTRPYEMPPNRAMKARQERLMRIQQMRDQIAQRRKTFQAEHGRPVQRVRPAANAGGARPSGGDVRGAPSYPPGDNPWRRAAKKFIAT